MLNFSPQTGLFHIEGYDGSEPICDIDPEIRHKAVRYIIESGLEAEYSYTVLDDSPISVEGAISKLAASKGRLSHDMFSEAGRVVGPYFIYTEEDVSWMPDISVAIWKKPTE